MSNIHIFITIVRRKQIPSSAVWTQPLGLSEQERSHRRHHADPRQQQQPAQLLPADLRPRLLSQSALRPAVHQGEHSHQDDGRHSAMSSSLSPLDQSLDQSLDPPDPAVSVASANLATCISIFTLI